MVDFLVFLQNKQLLSQEQVDKITELRSLVPDLSVEEILVDSNILSKEEVSTLKATFETSQVVEIEEPSVSFVETKAVVDTEEEKNLAYLLEKKQRFDEMNYSDSDIDEAFVRETSEKLIKTYRFVPMMKYEDTLYILVDDEINYKAADELRKIYHIKKFAYLIADSETLNTYIDSIFTYMINDDNEFSEDIDEEDIMGEDSPIVKFVNNMFNKAISIGVSDIHIEPQPVGNSRVRFRKDGDLLQYSDIPKKWHSQVISRIKIMAGLDISVRFEPQDGKIKIRYNHETINMRINTLPLAAGEKAVIRILAKADSIVSIDNVGFSDKNLKIVKEALLKKKGLILVTGPTGSGKTTTMYAMLQRLNVGHKNVSTIEDPVEITIAGLNQVQINERLSFADTLRALLRQDPDTLMIGEIRDSETADIAVRSSLTGHLVLSTLHTNNAIATITRLMDMNVEPTLLADSLLVVIAQRLVKRNCSHCTVEDEKGLENFHLRHPEHKDAVTKVFKGIGCKECQNTGLKGRVAIQEVLPIDEEIQRLIIKGDLEGLSAYGGTVLIEEDALIEVQRGTISVEEFDSILFDF